MPSEKQSSYRPCRWQSELTTDNGPRISRGEKGEKGAAIAPSFRQRKASPTGTKVAQFEIEGCVLGKPPLIGGSQRRLSKIRPPANWLSKTNTFVDNSKSHKCYFRLEIFLFPISE